MSRSGYSDDNEGLNLWRGAVNMAIRGKRGQALLRDLAAALDAMPEKRLVSGELEAEGSYCALGVVGASRGLNLASIDTCDYEALGANFNIAEALAREVMYVNDESVGDDEWKIIDGEWKRVEVKNIQERRWQLVRAWVAESIVADPVLTPKAAA